MIEMDPITYPEYPIDDAFNAMQTFVVTPLESIHITIREEGFDIRFVDSTGEVHVGNTLKGKAMPSAIFADAVDQLDYKRRSQQNVGLYARRDALQAEIDKINATLRRIIEES